nr:hypothetical protein GTC16762_23380 [Pigmentibacter ruber]
MKSFLNFDPKRILNELDFSEITKTLSIICKTNIAALSIKHDNELFFMSAKGLKVKKISYSESLCKYSIENKKLLIIENLGKDKKNLYNLYLRKKFKIVFYASFPLILKNGLVIGNILVMHRKTKILNKTQITILKNYAKIATNIIDLFQKNIELEAINYNYIKESRVNSISMLSSGISHEINTPLAIISGKIAIVDEKIKEFVSKEINSKIEKDFDTIKTGIERIRKIIISLRKFSEISDDEPYTENKLIDIFKAIFFLLEKKLQNNKIKIILNIDQDFKLKCRLINLSHVFFNLIINSYESLLNSLNEDKWIKIESNINDDDLVIKFIDNGIGLRKVDIDKIMEPFFSTKNICNIPKGLGLSIAKGIIMAQKGNLYYDNTANFTTFIVFFPLKKQF